MNINLNRPKSGRKLIDLVATQSTEPKLSLTKQQQLNTFKANQKAKQNERRKQK